MIFKSNTHISTILTYEETMTGDLFRNKSTYLNAELKYINKNDELMTKILHPMNEEMVPDCNQYLSLALKETDGKPIYLMTEK